MPLEDRMASWEQQQQHIEKLTDKAATQDYLHATKHWIVDRGIDFVINGSN